MNDIELLNSIKNNPEEFSKLFKLYYKPIFGYIFRRTGSFDEAVDIAVDTFYKAFNNINNFTYKGISIKVWLYHIATNEINLYFRFKKKHNKVFEQINFEDDNIFKNFISEDKRDLEIELQKHEQFVSILENLKTLPSKYQDVIALRYFEGKDNKEISEILNIKEGTIKSLLSRGLDKLRNKCGRLNQPDY